MQEGDVVYYVRDKFRGYGYEVSWGVVERIYPTEVILNLYNEKNMSTVNGIPILEWKPDPVGVFRKLPKGWTYNAKLVDIGHDPRYDSVLCGADLEDPEVIRELIDDGIMIRNAENEFRYPVAEFQRDGMYYLRWANSFEMQGRRYHPDSIVVLKDRVFDTCKEARDWIRRWEAEQRKVIDMEDSDWVKAQVEDAIARWADRTGVREDDSLCKHARDYLLGRPRFEDLCVRVMGGEAGEAWIQWRYNDQGSSWHWVPMP